MRVIAIAGKLGAGKTTVGKLLKRHAHDSRGLTVDIIPFNKPIKELALSIGWDGKKDAKGRRLLQLLGTEVCRECIDDEYWIKRWRAAVALSTADIVIVDDVRFEAEAAAIAEFTSSLILIAKRPEQHSWLAGIVQRLFGKQSIHKSETWVPKTPDFVLEHTALDRLSLDVWSLLEMILCTVRR